MGLIDLHIHSNYSDGTKSPATIVEMARRKGLQAIAITDHDTVDGVAEALEYGHRLGVEVIPGIEISSWHGETPMHILGYQLRHDDALLGERLQKLQEGRRIRNEHMVEKLNKLGMPVTLEELQACSGHGQAGRPHIAELLVDKGFVDTRDQAFYRFLRKGAAAYVNRFKYYASEAIAMIREAGGIAVLAHPAGLDPSLSSIPDLLRALQPLGLQGVEAFYPTHSSSDIRKLKNMTETMGLLVTGGTDFHGDLRSATPLGGTRKFRVPASLLEPLKRVTSQNAR
jgi:predicted metal-dependent phosphoesterase TrpH